MTKAERLANALAKAQLLHNQARYAEARLAYEQIIKGLTPKKKKPSKNSAY